MNDYEHEVDPKTGSFFDKFAMWTRHGERREQWTKERCEILGKLSRFVLEIIKADTNTADKENWTHWFANMIAMFDLLKIYRSPETMLNPELNQYKVLRYGSIG
jgi:hypothetical protein